jgi:uroporphyrinogen decarboxylase
MNKRDVVEIVLKRQKPPYVPWSFSFTHEAREKLINYFHTEDLEDILGNHFLELGNGINLFSEKGDDRFEDVFGAVWNRSVDKDIGIVENFLLKEPSLRDYTFPDPCDNRFFNGISDRILKHPDRFRIFSIGFSLFERAWSLRGMENLLMDFYTNPGFVRCLLSSIADYNIAQIDKALKYDIDAVWLGDDWGQQHGLIMGPKLWREFIFPELKRMYRIVKDAGKYVMIHSCGDVDELFDDLISIGLDCFNPFQPEVMDVDFLLNKYRDKLAFCGGLSTQKTLPFGSIQDVKNEVEYLIDLGLDGGYIFSPAHSVEGDVPLENMLVFIDGVKNQRGFRGADKDHRQDKKPYLGSR